MKKIAVYFDEPGSMSHPLSDETYFVVYRQMSDMIAEKGAEFYMVRTMESHLNGLTFTHAYRYKGEDVVEVPGPITFDMLWNKGHFSALDVTPVVNDPKLGDLTSDKWETYRAFPKLHAKTYFADDAKEMTRALEKIQTSLAVVKPVTGYGGNGVVVDEPENIPAQVHAFPVIVQEFINTSGGIEGVVEGMHDLRMIVINGTVGLCYVRTPPPDEYTANVSRGGREIEVPPEKIPQEALEMKDEVDDYMRRFKNRLYTIDIGRDISGNWHLIELNSKPGFSSMQTGPSYPPFYAMLADFLINVANGK